MCLTPCCIVSRHPFCSGTRTIVSLFHVYISLHVKIVRLSDSPPPNIHISHTTRHLCYVDRLYQTASLCILRKYQHTTGLIIHRPQHSAQLFRTSWHLVELIPQIKIKSIQKELSLFLLDFFYKAPLQMRRQVQFSIPFLLICCCNFSGELEKTKKNVNCPPSWMLWGNLKVTNNGLAFFTYRHGNCSLALKCYYKSFPQMCLVTLKSSPPLCLPPGLLSFCFSGTTYLPQPYRSAFL